MTAISEELSDERLAEMLAAAKHWKLLAPTSTEYDHQNNLEMALTELQSLRSGNGGEVRVKALSWSEFTSDENVLFMQAGSHGVRYEVFHKASDVAKIGIQVARFSRPDDPDDDGGDSETVSILGYGKDLAAAYAIAQADFNPRILSALDIKP